MSFLLLLIPNVPYSKGNLDRNQDDDDPFKMDAMLLAQRFPEDTRNLLCVIHLLIQGPDPNTHVKRFTDLIVVSFQTQLMPTAVKTPESTMA